MSSTVQRFALHWTVAVLTAPESWQPAPLMKTSNTAVPCARRAESNIPWYVALPAPVQGVLDAVENLRFLIAELFVAALIPLPWQTPSGGLIGPLNANEKPKRETFAWFEDTEKATLSTWKPPLAPEPEPPSVIVSAQIPGFGLTTPDEALRRRAPRAQSRIRGPWRRERPRAAAERYPFRLLTSLLAHTEWAAWRQAARFSARPAPGASGEVGRSPR